MIDFEFYLASLGMVSLGHINDGGRIGSMKKEGGTEEHEETSHTQCLSTIKLTWVIEPRILNSRANSSTTDLMRVSS